MRHGGRMKEINYYNTSPSIYFITKREQRPIMLKEEKKGEQLRTEGYYGERAGDWEEEGSKGGGRELREEA
jgi:hypothetical protein